MNEKEMEQNVEAQCKYMDFMEHFKPILEKLLKEKILTPEESWFKTNQSIQDYFNIKPVDDDFENCCVKQDDKKSREINNYIQNE